MMIETREVPGVKVRAEDDGGGVTIAGRGIPYGDWSEDLGGFRERFAPGAFRESLADDDIRALFNHDSNLVLGRTGNRTLRLDEREDGVHYEVDINPQDGEAMAAVARVRRGDISANSFGFFIERDSDQEWEERDGVYWRTVKRARLRELGPQTFPAYPSSDVAVRTLRQAQEWLAKRGKPVEHVRRLVRLKEQEYRLRLTDTA